MRSSTLRRAVTSPYAAPRRDRCPIWKVRMTAPGYRKPSASGCANASTGCRVPRASAVAWDWPSLTRLRVFMAPHSASAAGQTAKAPACGYAFRDLRRRSSHAAPVASLTQAPLRIVAPMDRRSQQSPARACRGITLLEMITVMGIAAILMAIAVPSYKYVTNSNRIAAEVNGLLGDMQFARGEAIKEGQTVTVCVSTDGATCLVNTAWNSGWIVFSDPNNNQQVDGNEQILRVQAGFTSTDTFVANLGISAVTFNREGFAAADGAGLAGGAALITLHASPAVADWTRCLSMNMVGMMVVQTPKTQGAACL